MPRSVIDVPRTVAGTRTVAGNRFLVRGTSALTFDGTGDYVDVGTLGNFLNNLDSGSFSFAFWEKNTDKTNKFFFLGNQTSSSNSLTMKINMNSSDSTSIGRFGGFVRDASNVFFNYATTNVIPGLSDGTWHHIVATGTPSTNTINIYFDSVSQAVSKQSANTPNNFSNFLNPFVIGAVNSNGTPTAGIVGSLKDVFISNAILTQEQVTDLYYKGIYPTANVVGFWKFDEESGTTAIDSTGTQANGTITNAVYTTAIPFPFRTVAA